MSIFWVALLPALLNGIFSNPLKFNQKKSIHFEFYLDYFELRFEYLCGLEALSEREREREREVPEN